LDVSLQCLLITDSYSANTNLPTSQVTRSSYPFPSNGFITGTISLNHCEVFLPLLVQSPWNADPSELDPTLQFQFSNPPSQSQGHIATDGQSVSESVSKSCCRVPSEVMTRYLLLFDSYGLVFVGALSPTRGPGTDHTENTY
jgi:hypothetical protein